MRNPVKVMLIMAVSLFAVSCFFLTAQAEIPRLINYQGKLTDRTTGEPLEGVHSVTFKIYDAQTGPGQMLPWEEPHQINFQKGLFSVLLGSVSDLNLEFDKPYWLGIKIDADDEMEPRQQIASSGYAIRAEEVDSLPQGIITMWSGRIVDIPDGWILCDGTNGTPDLRDRFIAGAGREYAVGASGGEKLHTLTIAEMPGHTHNYWKAINMGGDEHGNGEWNDGNNNNEATESTGGGGAHENRPPYYALAYIMKQ